MTVGTECHIIIIIIIHGYLNTPVHPPPLYCIILSY